MWCNAAAFLDELEIPHKVQLFRPWTSRAVAFHQDWSTAPGLMQAYPPLHRQSCATGCSHMWTAPASSVPWRSECISRLTRESYQLPDLTIGHWPGKSRTAVHMSPVPLQRPPWGFSASPPPPSPSLREEIRKLRSESGIWRLGLDPCPASKASTLQV